MIEPLRFDVLRNWLEWAGIFLTHEIRVLIDWSHLYVTIDSSLRTINITGWLNV